MPRRTSPRRPTLRLVFTLCALSALLCTLPGCLDAEETILARYDAAKDEFVFLNLYQRIGGTAAGDADYLAALHKNRDHVITPPFPSFLGKNAFLRFSAHEYARMTLGNRPSVLEKENTPIDLSSVRVLPGTFFLRDADTLCWYDQVVVPGKVVDETIPWLAPLVGSELAEKFNQEIDRRKHGGKPAGWGSLRAKVLEGIAPPTGADSTPQAAAGGVSNKTEPREGINGSPAHEREGATGAAEPDADLAANPQRVLSDDSLQKLTKALADPKTLLTRDKQTVKLQLPLSEDDTKQALILADAVRAEWKKQAADPKADEGTRAQAKAAELVQTHPGPAGGIELSLDLTALFAVATEFQHPTGPLPPLPDKQQGASSKPTAEDCRRMVKSAREKNLPIDEKLTVEQVIAAFHEGTLPAHPSDRPVPPGEGLVTAP